MPMEDSNVAEALAQFKAVHEPTPPKINVEVTQVPAPTLVQQTAFDRAVEQRVMQKLEDAGIRSTRDLELGRADQGKIAALLKEAEFIDDKGNGQINPFIADKILRNYEYQQQAGVPMETPETVAAPEQTAPAPAEAPAPANDHLAQLQAAVEAAKAEADEWKRKYGDRENKLGEERRRTAERLARLEAGNQGRYSAPVNTPYQAAPVSYDPRILGERDPNVPLTAAETAALFQQMASAFGQQLSARDNQIIEAARNLRDYNLTPNEEADLIEKHTWLGTLDRPAQIAAMRDLAPTLKPPQPSQPAPAPIQPQRSNLAELARARVRTATTFIEPSSQGSPQETDAAAGVNTEYQKRMSRIQELLRTPGGSDEAERLINELSRRR